MSNKTESELLFNKFQIQECLKKDEHSAVYLGTQKNSSKKQIIKVLHTKNLTDESILKRFNREAKILTSLNHPNIINVIDFGIYEDSFFISFEYFKGNNLRQLIKNKQLSLEEKIDILIQIFKGISYAHANGIIHRDIKPENIIVSDSLKVKIIDFGLAQGYSDNFATTQNAIVGTPSYMSPEQIFGEKMTIQSDLFSAGIVAYELLIGNNPFLGRDVNETINHIISYNNNFSILKLEELPDFLQEIIKNLLRTDKNQRFQSADKVLELLGYKINAKKKIEFFIKKNRKILVAYAIILLLLCLVYLYRFQIYENYMRAKPNLIIQDTTSYFSLTDNPSISDTSKEILPIAKDTSKSQILSMNNQNSESTNILTPIKKSGELFIECIPWAYIYLNSEKIETTPLKNPLLVLEGDYHLELIHPNYPKYSVNIKIRPDKMTNIKVNLDTLFGYLDCKVFPWSEVIVNDQNYGETPFQKPLKLAPGNYKITLQNNKYESVSFNIKISRNETFLLKYNFENGK